MPRASVILSAAKNLRLAAQRCQHLLQLLAGRQRQIDEEPLLPADFAAAAGLTDVHLEPIDLTFTLGASPDDAMGYLVESGPGRLLLETIPDGTARQAALADVRDTLADHTDDGTVQLGGAIWLISAARPPAGEASDS